jgi:hypothetical protein
MLSSLLFMQGCQMATSLDPKPWCKKSPYEKMRPWQIKSITPGDNYVIQPLDRPMPSTQGYFLSAELGAFDEQDIDLSSVRLFFNGSEVTGRASIRSVCGRPADVIVSPFQPICGTIQYGISGPLKAGRHTAAICFQNKQGKNYCYDWAFYADAGDGSGLKALCPGESVVPPQVGGLNPGQNQTLLTNEEVWVKATFITRGIKSPNSIKIFLDAHDLTNAITWSPPPWREVFFFVYHIPARILGIGKHIVRIEFQDKSSQIISYSWSFYIQIPDES